MRRLLSAVPRPRRTAVRQPRPALAEPVAPGGVSARDPGGVRGWGWNVDEDDYLPLSLLNQLAYCRRRFYLIHVLGEEDVNAALLEGQLLHERVHDAGLEHADGRTIRRRVPVWSDRLRVNGFTDVIEEAAGEIVPVEYKHGRMGRWLNDHIQLCAQALCLEERTGRPVSRGEIFYWGSRRRERVALTADLRARTEDAVRAAYALARARRAPPPLDHPAKCRDCSLEPICLPRETLALMAQGPLS